MGVPIKYRKNTENSIITYDWIDLNEGTGIIELCGFAASTAAATYEYLLTTNKNMYSAKRGYEDLGSFDQKFDITFNTPQYVMGTAYARVPLYLYSQSAPNITGYIKIQIYHYDGSTETAITSEITSESFTIGSSVTIVSAVVKIPITTEKLFKIGDKLRVRIQGFYSGGTGSVQHNIMYEPNGSYIGSATAGDLNSRLSIFVPVRLDL